MERLLTQSEVAELLGIAPRAMESWRLRGTGPRYVRVGRLIRYRNTDVSAWLAARERASTSDPGPAPDRAA
jgi:predicted DNA-binding transcriptional regulator AlpA